MRRTIIFLFIIFCFLRAGKLFSQGYNHTWLLGYDYTPTSAKARMNFDLNFDTLITEQRKIPIGSATEGNISDKNGNLLMASNGVWIANATGDTMLNGSGLNPNSFTTAYSNGLPLGDGNLFLQWPGDSTKYILFHQTGNYNANLSSTELFYSIIDLTLDSGLGGVIQKNVIVISDTLGWGITACKHANGRDWWVVILNDSMQYIYKALLTPSGLSNPTIQYLPNMQPYSMFAAQPAFSFDGSKFAYASSYGIGNGIWYHDVRLLSFDRCNGNFFNPQIINLTDSIVGLGVSFSSDSKYLYASSLLKIFQLNTDTSNIPASLQVVAVNDSFVSPFPAYTDFFQMYLAANGKIYITSGSTVLDLHYMNYPDSAGIACDVHQHAIHLPCFHGRAVPNHPNYYLGPVIGSICDSIPPVGIYEQNNHDFHFSVSPNPVMDGYLHIVYLLPQNKAGVFEVFDMTGRKVFKIPLPPWSTLQQITLPKLMTGIYNALITSDGYKTSKKVAVFRK
jgi:hypothetical protein